MKKRMPERQSETLAGREDAAYEKKQDLICDAITLLDGRHIEHDRAAEELYYAHAEEADADELAYRRNAFETACYNLDHATAAYEKLLPAAA